jgi:hypothetical protein
LMAAVADMQVLSVGDFLRMHEEAVQ